MNTFTEPVTPEETSSHPFSHPREGESRKPITDQACVQRFIKVFNECAESACAGIDSPGYLQLSCLQKDGNFISQRFLIGDIETMTAVAIEWSESGLGNVYIEGRTIRSDASPVKNGRGKKEHTGAVFALTIDNDPDKLLGASLDLEPTIRTETSSGNTHETYFLDKAVSLKVGEDLGHMLKTAVGTSDFDTGNITQPYRVAGTVNYVNAKKRARGRVDCETKILSVGRAYSPNEFRTVLEASGGRSKKESTQSQTYTDSTDKTVDELLVRSWWKAELEQRLAFETSDPEYDRSTAFYALIGQLQREGYSPAEALKLFAAYPNSCWNDKYRNRLQAEMIRAWKKIGEEASTGTDSTQSSDESEGKKSHNNQADNDASGNSQSSSDWWMYGDPMPKEPTSLIKGLVPAQGVFFIGGQSGAGKSFATTHMAMALASGHPFFGHEIPEAAGTIIIACEGGDTVAPRLVAARIGLELEDAPRPIAVIRHNIGDLSSPTDYKLIIEKIKAANSKIRQRFGMSVKMVVVDTVAAGFSLKDENSAAEMQRLCKGLAGLGECIGALALGVHHYGKSSESGLRGSSAVRAAADGVLAVLADRDELTGKCSNRRLVLTKSRSGIEGATYSFDLQSVEISTDGFDSVLSAKVVPREKTIEGGKAEGTGRSYSVGLKRFLSSLTQSLLDFGHDERVFADGPILRVVDREKVRKNFFANTPADGDKNTADASRRQAFKRAYQDAERRNLAKCFEKNGTQLMWLLNKECA